MSKPQKFTSRLASIEKVSSKVYLKRFDLVTPREIAFLPGQTVMLQVAPGINRSMSIASPPSEKTSILVAHDVSPMGPYSRWTINANVGDEMHFIGPLGMFILDAASPRKKVFIATGTGIAPFRSMITDELNRQGTRNNKQMTLFWGLRHETDVYWKDEFTSLADQHTHFQFVLTLSQGSPAWTGFRGHVTDHVLRLEKDWENSDFYLCGNKMMVDQMREGLLTKNVPKGQIKSELFY